VRSWRNREQKKGKKKKGLGRSLDGPVREKLTERRRGHPEEGKNEKEPG